MTTASAARLLFVGDIHLGRRPSRLPADLDDHGIQPSELGPVAAWRATVREAIGSRVDAVVLAGDVVESIEDRFEAYGHLASGVRELVDAGIPVFGVAGNHDVQALPRLAEQIPGFRLLGRGGVWEGVPLERGDSQGDGEPLVLLGWSFSSVRVAVDPLDSLSPELLQALPAGAPVLGVLHCDLDAGASHYAPVSRTALERRPVDAWLLGHIHKPSALEGDRPIGYLGSLVGLDPGEPGARGPWLVEVEGAGRVRARQLPIAPLRWERVDLDLAGLDPCEVSGSGAGDESELDLADRFFGLLRARLRAVRDRIGADLAGARAVGCRVRLLGRCREHRALRSLVASDVSGREALRERWPRETWEGVHFFVEKIEDLGAPAIDLGRLARGSDPAALLARRLVAIESGGPEAERLIAAATRRLAGAMRTTPVYDALEGTRAGSEADDGRHFDPSVVAPEEVRRALMDSGTRALEELLAQRAGANVGGAA